MGGSSSNFQKNKQHANDDDDDDDMIPMFINITNLFPYTAVKKSILRLYSSTLFNYEFVSGFFSSLFLYVLPRYLASRKSSLAPPARCF